MPQIDFIYDDTCPNVAAARSNLHEALLEIGLPSVWSEHRIGNPSLPQRVRGFGSPTVLVDGRDVAGVAPQADQCCRIYASGGGVPPVALIVQALTRT